jgi:hypothetical protein
VDDYAADVLGVAEVLAALVDLVDGAWFPGRAATRVWLLIVGWRGWLLSVRQ